MKTLSSLLTFQLLLTIATAQSPSDFVRASGSDLVVGANDDTICLRGINFAYGYSWYELDTSTISTIYHYTEADLEKVHDMNMNVIRLTIHNAVLEDSLDPFVYKPEGWEWLDTHIEWASQHDVYVIINIHIPPCSDLMQHTSYFWDDPYCHDRLTAMWRAIADRYKNEPMVAGYDILNEPHASYQNQWQNMAQEIIDTIRTVDNNHLLIVENDYSYGEQFLVNDNNVIYDIHFYEPERFVFSDAAWADFVDGGVYPDTNQNMFPSDLEWADGTWGNLPLSSGNTPWTYLEGELKYIPDTSTIMCAQVLLLSEYGEGEVWFDNIVVKEYDADQNFIQDLLVIDFDTNTFLSAYGWYGLPENGDATFIHDSTQGYTNSHSLAIHDVGSTYAYWTNNYAKVPVRPDHHYQINGYLKGEGLAASSYCEPFLDFFRSNGGGLAMVKDINYLEYELETWLNFGIINNVPMNVGEFGLNVFSNGPFYNNSGGYQWVTDMLYLLDQHDLNFQYYAFHDGGYGLYYNHGGLPDPAFENTQLTDIFMNSFPACNSIITVREESEESNSDGSLMTILPNPFTGHTKLVYSGKELKQADLSLYNTLGKEVLTMDNLNGSVIQLDGSQLVTGVYFVFLKQDNATLTSAKLIVR